MRDPFDNLNLDHTDTPSFPNEPEELGNVSNSTSIPAFNFNSSFRSEPEQPKVVNDEEKSTSIPAFNFNKPVDEETPKKSNSAFDLKAFMNEDEDQKSSAPLFPDVPVEIEQPDSPLEATEQTAQLPTMTDDSNGGGNNIPPQTPKNKKSKKPKKGEFKKEPTVLNIIVTIFTIVANILVVYILFNTTKFSSIGQNIFMMINIVVLAILLLLDLLVILMIRTRKIALFVISVIVLSLFVGGEGYGFYALGRVNKNVNKITGEKKEEEVSASLVIYSGTSGDPITDVKDLEGRRVGVAKGTKTEEIAKTKLSSSNTNVEYVEVNGYTDLLSNLITGAVDCAVLPVNYQSQFEEDENLSAYLPDTQSILDFSETITSESETGANKDITKEPFTVLVTGENEGLADSIILMSVNPISMKVTMTSIARDSYVPISCYGSSEKINAAHASSESCMVKTVENLMGIDIDYTIEFNFASVVQVVDAVGGVVVDIPVSFDAQCWNIYTDELAVFRLEAGENVYLDGARALGFVRERMAFPDGDFARQKHQQEVMEQIIQKIMSSKDPQMFLNVLDAAGDNIKTNFTVEQMTGFINYALQKSKRYYDSNNISGLFNFESSRVYGYAANLWNSSLQMDLWIYRLFNGSIQDCANAIKRNLSTTATPDTPASVSWSAANTFTPDPVSQEVYNETRITDDGRPADVPEPSESTEPTDSPTPSASASPTTSSEPTPEPTVEPTPEPTVVPTTEPTVEPTTPEQPVEPAPDQPGGEGE
jgi:LCP family protein required for cell wall assembly